MHLKPNTDYPIGTAVYYINHNGHKKYGHVIKLDPKQHYVPPKNSGVWDKNPVWAQWGDNVGWMPFDKVFLAGSHESFILDNYSID